MDEEEKETNIDDVATHIGSEYSNEDAIIIEIHKMISEINSITEYETVYDVIKDRFGTVSEEIDIYMKQELVEKLIDKLKIKLLVNDKMKFTLKLDNDVYSKLNIEDLFIEATKICTRFNFAFRADAIHISLNKENLEKHYINYIMELLIYIDSNIKR